MQASFFHGKNVFITGHTGFKGSWLCHILANAGANVTGYALAPATSPSLFELSGVGSRITSVIGDVRDADHLLATFRAARPEYVLHMAAQPLVRESYLAPAATYETNVMGTVNILECLRHTDGVLSFLNVTTDKVYQNNEWPWGYRETDTLCGFDPYSNSKSCSELVTQSYRQSFFADKRVAISTARAGNVIGGGDFSKDRILPDCIAAAAQGQSIFVRNPASVRPYQHVLEPLFAYLMILQRQAEDPAVVGCYNIGPDDADCVSTGTLADLFCAAWGPPAAWHTGEVTGPHEAGFLKLDCSKAKQTFGWRPAWHIATAVEKTVEWAKAHLAGQNLATVMDRQIEEYMAVWGDNTNV